jgi:hypothetical protein
MTWCMACSKWSRSICSQRSTGVDVFLEQRLEVVLGKVQGVEVDLEDEQRLELVLTEDVVRGLLDVVNLQPA